MANLAGKPITNKTYQSVATLLGISIGAGKYVIQTRGGVHLCVKGSQPDENEGFLLKDNCLVQYEQKDGETLYAKVSVGGAFINIAN